MRQPGRFNLPSINLKRGLGLFRIRVCLPAFLAAQSGRTIGASDEFGESAELPP